MANGKENYKEVLSAYTQMTGAFLIYLKDRYVHDGCRESAAALTYMTLFSVVPLMTMMYTMFSIIPAFQGFGGEIEQLIFMNLMPSSGVEVQDYLRSFSNQAQKLSAVGGFILIITSYLMLSNIEKTFNRIWETVGARRGLSGFLLYWGVLSFGPLLLGAGLLMHTYLLSFQLMVDDIDALGLMAALLQYLPWLMTWAGFTMVFAAMPNCRVVFRHALWGGMLTALCFQLAKGLFGLLVANSSYHTIYGAFAIVPVFLLWVYFCWMIVLAGAECVRALGTFKASYRPCNFSDFVATTIVFAECLRLQRKGEILGDKDILTVGVEAQQWLRLRSRLLEKKVLAATADDAYVLMIDPSQLTLWDVKQLLNDELSAPLSAQGIELLEQYPWFARLSVLMATNNDDMCQLFSVSLSELFDANIKTG